MLAAVVASGIPLGLQAQYQDLNAAPIQSTSPSGSMSTRDMQLQQVRQQAQALQGEAAAASMARSADRSLDQQNVSRAVQDARELKAIKREAAERLKWERSNAQVQKVSANDMSSWTTHSGNVRVERDVPNAFIASLIAEEEEAARRGTLEKPKKRFSPRDLNPFRKDDPEPLSPYVTTQSVASAPMADPPEEKKGFFSKVRIPGFGGRDEPDSNEPLPEAPVFRSSPGDRPAPAPSVGNSAMARTVPQRSGAALVDGGPPPAVPAEAGESRSGSPQLVSYSPAEPEKEKEGLFAAFKKSDSPSLTPEPKKSGGLFSFGKKKEESTVGTIDASLFPTGAVDEAPTGRELSGGYTVEDVADDMTVASSAATSVSLPGESPEKKKFFSIPKPSLSIPSISIPSAGKPSGSGRGEGVPTLTTINSQGNDFYVVTETAQFMVYGEEQMQSEVRALPAGNVVRMTKPGEQWASIRLPNGTEGVVQNKFLRAASGAEAGGQFAATN